MICFGQLMQWDKISLFIDAVERSQFHQP